LIVARVLYFAWLREAIGVGEEAVAILAGDVTVADLAERLRARGGGYEHAFADLSRVRAAVDQAMVPLDTSLVGASEIAFFPPVTGG